MTHDKKSRKNFEVYTAEEFIAAITQHIPDKSFQMVRYYGWYSNKSRGIRRKQGILRPGDEQAAEPEKDIEIIELSDYQPRRIPSKTWRECIKKVYEVNPLLCPRCGGDMRIISFITEPKITRRILEHLDLWVWYGPLPVTHGIFFILTRSSTCHGHVSFSGGEAFSKNSIFNKTVISAFPDN